MTDEELVAYVENRIKKAYSEGFNKGKRIVEQRTKVVKWNSKNYMKKH